MSIATEIQRLQTAKTDVKTSLLKKGFYIDNDRRVSDFSSIIDSNESIPWKDNPSNYLSFYFVENGSVSWQHTSVNIQYSKDGGTTWTDFGDSAISVNQYEEIWFKGDYNGGIGSSSESSSSKFITSGHFFVSGDPLSLTNFATYLRNYHFAYLFKDCSGLNIDKNKPLILSCTTLGQYCYAYMFSGCTSLTTAPELPATALQNCCYREMFKGCSIEIAPELPAVTLSTGCYLSMFRNCSALRRSPVLRASTLVANSYQYMFNGCSNLSYILMLASTHSASRCLQSWVTSVSSTGIFIKNASTTTLPSGAAGIPTGWTVIDA